MVQLNIWRNEQVTKLEPHVNSILSPEIVDIDNRLIPTVTCLLSRLIDAYIAENLIGGAGEKKSIAAGGAWEVPDRSVDITRGGCPSLFKVHLNSKTTTATNDPLAAMFQNATIDKAEKSEFSNSARDTIKLIVNNTYNYTKEGENLVPESSDVIDFFRNVVQPFLAEVGKNDQSRSTVGDTTATNGSDPDPVPLAMTIDHTVEGNPVDIVDLVPSEPSSLPIASVADRYTRSMLRCLAGYPLYEPQPFSELSREYLRHGINVGDVGFVRGTGVFDFLFNICPPQNGLINPSNLSDGFSLEIADHSTTRAHLRKTSLLQTPITKTKSGEYICEGSEGAILELPEGAIQDEATNILPFERLAARYGVHWYKYTMARGRKISNGSLYLITSVTKCAQWGIAVFDRTCAPGQGLRFDKKISLPFSKSTTKYHWKGSRTFPTKVSNLNNEDTPNQCVFLRGYKIMIRKDIFDDLCNDQPGRSNSTMPSSSSQAESIALTRQPATRIRGGGGLGPQSKKLTGGGLLSWARKSSMTKSDEVVLQANFNSSLVHPSDVINAGLLSQNLDAKVALTHDDIWCDLLRENFPKLNYATLINIARSYRNMVDEYGCVSLEKTYNSGNNLEQSQSTPKGIDATALQAPFTTPANESTPLPTSAPLPRELVERILLLLDTKSMLTCKLVNREFNGIIQCSTLLQYFLACKAAGVIDNPQSPLFYAERLEALKKREEAWQQLTPVFQMTIPLNHQTSSPVCRSTEGVFFHSDYNQKDLNYFHLTSSPQDDPQWIRIPGHGPALDWAGILVNSVAALNEQDLIVNLISSDIENQADLQLHSLDLVFLQFSTGEYHPLASHPRIHVQRSPEVKPWIVSRIVDNNLALIVHSLDGTFDDKLFIFDWKTGRKRLQHETTENAYFSLVFVSPELLLVPNCVLSHFEVWHLPQHELNPKPPIQILSLQIPTLSPEYTIFDFGCYGEPNPFLRCMSYLPLRPFFSSPKNAIITITLRMVSSEGPLASYNLIMHRHALLDTIQALTSPSLLEQQEYLQTWLTNELIVQEIADPEDGSIQLDAQSKLLSTMPHPRSSPRTGDSPTLRTFPTSDISADSVSPALSRNSAASPCMFLQVPWAKWGPPISRWFQVSNNHARWWTGHSYGQRYAFLDPDREFMVSVVDFNPHNLRRNAATMRRVGGGEGENNSGNCNKGKEEEDGEFEILDHEGVFSEEVYMGLKCMVSRVPGEHDFDLLLMDEQRLLGVKLNGYGWEESIKVIYIG